MLAEDVAVRDDVDMTRVCRCAWRCGPTRRRRSLSSGRPRASQSTRLWARRGGARSAGTNR
eukprot:8963824-Lingulodinium_polyedra.AAC.1